MAFRRQLDGPLFATLPYEDIRRAAHGMAGAAAMFDAGQIATAAAELEAAARDAHLVGGESGFLKVRVRLETLIRIVRETRG
jgi:HPt (histidine-containing phosphotransfer) domain-containing protein